MTTKGCRDNGAVDTNITIPNSPGGGGGSGVPGMSLHRLAKNRGFLSTELHTRAAAESGRGCIYRHVDGVHDKQRKHRPLSGGRIYMRL